MWHKPKNNHCEHIIIEYRPSAAIHITCLYGSTHFTHSATIMYSRSGYWGTKNVNNINT